MSTTSAGATPSCSRRRPRVPNIGLVKDCVAIAPTPLIACGQRAPIAKALVVTAMPKAPLDASRATIDQVIVRLLLPPRGKSRCRHESRPRPALDGGGDQAVDVEAVTDHLQHAELFLTCLAVPGDDVAGPRIGGLPPARRQRPPDPLEGLPEPVILVEPG